MKIELKGIKRNTPGVISEDGELEELVNLRYKDGAFRPIPNRSTVLTDLNYTDIYIHSNSGYKHYLGVREDKLYYFAQDIASEAKKHTEIEICDLSGEVTFTQMGNVINILDSQGIKYAVWYDDGYKLIDSNFDGLQTTDELIGKVDLRVTGILNSVNGERDVRFYYSDSSFSIVSGVFLNAEGLWDKAVATEKKDGRLIDFFLACTAIELYDGSYIMHSNPVLCGQSWDQYTRYEGISLPGISTPFNYNSTSKPTFFMDYTTGIVHNASDKYYNKGANSFPVGYKTSITDLTNLKEYPNLSVLWRHNEGDAATPLYAPISANKLQFKINTPIPSKYLPLIKSISVFMTDPVSMYDFTKLDNTYQWAKIGTDGLFSEYPKIRTNKEISKDIENSSVFYKVYEIIPFEDIASDSNTPLQLDTWIDIDLKEKLENLRSQEALTYDNFSHHQMLPEVQFMYNSKLHLGDMKTLLSRGFPLGNFFTEMGVGQFAGSDYALAKIGYWIEVSIKTSNGLTKVVRYKERTLDNVKFYDISSFVAYPDARATKMVIHLEMCFNSEIQWYTKEYEFKLTAHTTQNYAYHISDDLKPQWKAPAFALSAFTHPAEVQREQINSNVCRVSEINNPFVFPVENTYSIGNGEIKAFSTNTIELSVGQAGQFPLYIFTSDGIYALFIGGAEVNYASSRPISREVINNKNVKPVDNGVIFTTDKGVMIISGSQVQDLSEVLRGDFLDISNQTTFQKTKSGLTMLQEIVANDKLVQLSTAITTENVLEFIKNAIVGYKYIDKEIWFTNPDKDYSYIFSKGLWTKITQTGTRFINDYPRQLILNGSDIVDIAGETAGDTQTMFITRPLKMGDGFKQMITAVVRGDFKTNVALQHHAGIYIFGSYDGKRWNFLGGHEAKGELKDLGAKVERTDCKYFRIAFVGNISTDSTINYIEIEGKESLLNKKIR